jgi:branched-chain amino acid transport system permease protein
LLGALTVWAIWSLSGIAIAKSLPPHLAAQGGALQVILIGLMLVLSLLWRPRGLIGEEVMVSHHAADSP